jgi:hypothetical protein
MNGQRKELMHSIEEVLIRYFPNGSKRENSATTERNEVREIADRSLRRFRMAVGLEDRRNRD